MIPGNKNKMGVLQVQGISPDGRPVLVDFDEEVRRVMAAAEGAKKPDAKPKAAVVTKPVKGGD